MHANSCDAIRRKRNDGSLKRFLSTSLLINDFLCLEFATSQLPSILDIVHSVDPRERGTPAPLLAQGLVASIP